MYLCMCLGVCAWMQPWRPSEGFPALQAGVKGSYRLWTSWHSAGNWTQVLFKSTVCALISPCLFILPSVVVLHVVDEGLCLWSSRITVHILGRKEPRYLVALYIVLKRFLQGGSRIKKLKSKSGKISFWGAPLPGVGNCLNKEHSCVAVCQLVSGLFKCGIAESLVSLTGVSWSQLLRVAKEDIRPESHLLQLPWLVRTGIKLW